MARDFDPLVEVPDVPFLPLDTPEPVRSCATCNNLRGNRVYSTNWIDWECFKLPIGIHPITGNRVFGTCAEARSSKEDMLCGISGKWWVLYEKREPIAPDPEDTPTPAPKVAKFGGKKFDLDL